MITNLSTSMMFGYLFTLVYRGIQTNYMKVLSHLQLFLAQEEVRDHHRIHWVSRQDRLSSEESSSCYENVAAWVEIFIQLVSEFR